MRLRTTIVFVLGLALAGPLYAQTTGRLLGVVRDESRAVLPGTTVTTFDSSSMISSRNNDLPPNDAPVAFFKEK